MDVGDEGDARAPPDIGERFRSRLIRNRQAHDLAASPHERFDLGDRLFDLMGKRIAHRLNGDRSVAADLHPAHPNLAARTAVERKSGWIGARKRLRR